MISQYRQRYSVTKLKLSYLLCISKFCGIKNLINPLKYGVELIRHVWDFTFKIAEEDEFHSNEFIKLLFFIYEKKDKISNMAMDIMWHTFEHNLLKTKLLRDFKLTWALCWEFNTYLSWRSSDWYLWSLYEEISYYYPWGFP